MKTIFFIAILSIVYKFVIDYFNDKIYCFKYLLFLSIKK